MSRNPRSDQTFLQPLFPPPHTIYEIIAPPLPFTIITSPFGAIPGPAAGGTMEHHWSLSPTHGDTNTAASYITTGPSNYTQANTKGLTMFKAASQLLPATPLRGDKRVQSWQLPHS